jgi:hypothetical protein
MAVSIKLGPLQFTLRALGRAVSWPFKTLSGSFALQQEIRSLRDHISAMTDVFHLVIATLSKDWTIEQRERIQRSIARFTILEEGVKRLEASQNPLSSSELKRLQVYVEKAGQGEAFSQEEAQDFKGLADRVAREHSGQDWVAELIKLALFIFALYVLAEILKPVGQKTPP